MSNQKKVSLSADKKIELTKQYYDARLEGNIEKCLTFVSDDIYLDSERNGKFRGKIEFEKYLKDHPFEGTWGQPYMESLHVRIDGKVKMFFISVGVKFIVYFDNCGKISKAFIRKIK